jgi:hypothetical protein
LRQLSEGLRTGNRELIYCGDGGFAGGGVPDAGLFVLVPVAGFGAFFFVFFTGFSGSVSSTTIFFGGSGGAA